MKSLSSVLRYLKVKEKFYVLYGRRRQEGVVTGREDYGIYKLYVWDDCVQTKRDSSNIKNGIKRYIQMFVLKWAWLTCWGNDAV